MVAIVDVYWLITFGFLLPLVLKLRHRKGVVHRVELVVD